jgi:anti-sigma factor RsiW
MKCRRAFDADLTAVVRGEASDADFTAHAATCPDCAAELRVWTELDALLRAGAPSADADGDHPEPETLAAYVDAPATLVAAARTTVERHLASCPVCADEVGSLRRFDATRFAAARVDVATPEARAPRSRIARVLWHPAFAYALVTVLLVPLVRELLPRLPDESRVVDSRRELAAPAAKPAAPLARQPESLDLPLSAPAIEKQKAPEEDHAPADERGRSVEHHRDRLARAPGTAGHVDEADDAHDADDAEGAPSLHDLGGAFGPPSEAAAPRQAATEPEAVVIDVSPRARAVVSSVVTDRPVRLRITPPADFSAGPLDVRVRAHAGAREIATRVTDRADAIVVEIPPRWLAPGDYDVTLSPAVPGGARAESAVATLGFTVRASTAADR